MRNVLSVVGPDALKKSRRDEERAKRAHEEVSQHSNVHTLVVSSGNRTLKLFQLLLLVPADMVPRRRRLAEGCSDLDGQVLSAPVRLWQANQHQITWNTLYFILRLINVSCDWSDRAVKRLQAARVQKDVAEATKVIKQQELHKSLRVRWSFSCTLVLTSALSNQDNYKSWN